jgi:3-hydroxybutyrate dehydrogenase
MLSGKTALITGSTAGLGLAIATRLAKAGCDIMLHGILQPEEAEAARANLQAETGRRVLYRRADLVNPPEIEALMAHIGETIGGPDIVVNNAAVRNFAPVEKMTTAQWDTALAVNLSSAFHTTRLAVTGMRAKGWGRIINIASTFAFFAVEDRVEYVTTKTALLGFTRAIALETARDGITCNAICPGSILTEAIEGRLQREMASTNLSRAQFEEEFLAKRQPTRRFVDAGRIGGLAVFLCGPDSADITGAALPIDGAWSVA